MALKYATRTSPQIKSQCRSTNYTSMATKEGGQKGKKYEVQHSSSLKQRTDKPRAI